MAQAWEKEELRALNEAADEYGWSRDCKQYKERLKIIQGLTKAKLREELRAAAQSGGKEKSAGKLTLVSSHQVVEGDRPRQVRRQARREDRPARQVQVRHLEAGHRVPGVKGRKRLEDVQVCEC